MFVLKSKNSEYSAQYAAEQQVRRPPDAPLSVRRFYDSQRRVACNTRSCGVLPRLVVCSHSRRIFALQLMRSAAQMLRSQIPKSPDAIAEEQNLRASKSGVAIQ